MKNYKYSGLLIGLLLCPIFLFAQGKNFWNANTNHVQKKLHRQATQMNDSTTLTLDVSGFKNYIQKAALRKQPSTTKILMTFPLPDGKMIDFKIQKTNTLSPALEAKYSSISSYVGISLDKKLQLRITLTKNGIYGMILGGNGLIFINPTENHTSTYIVFNRKNNTQKMTEFYCKTNQKNSISVTNNSNAQRSLSVDNNLRTYRLAVATTGEYSNYHINLAGLTNGTLTQKKAAVLAAITVTMDRVNAVYERDFAVTMQLVPNEETIIFLDEDLDPFSNNDASKLIKESQTVIDTKIGTTNYDIGHTFSTGAGGLAGVGVVCSPNSKAKGVTGTSSPIGDSYSIDYVCHEMGHQFGATHTFNNSCSGNRTNATAVEPGSGVTIMAYAGICPPNIAANSIPYFHAVSIAQVSNFIKNYNGATCAVLSPLNNQAPQISPVPNYTIPNGTAFFLQATATDPESGSLSYSWEQIDNQTPYKFPQAPSPTATSGPNFRSLTPTSDSKRSFPTISAVLNGELTPTWEVVPSVARSMNFRLTVRDNHLNGGQTASEDVKITFAESGPFQVTSQATAATWQIGGSVLVTWKVAQTDIAPINTSQVNILLSTDGGQHFSTTLVSKTPNDGQQIITLPANLQESTVGRIMIKAEGNIFYAVNAAPITLKKSAFALDFSEMSQSVCQSNTAAYEFTYRTDGSFSGTTTFSAVNLPSGIQANFAPASATTDGTIVKLTLTNTSAVAVGDYTFSVQANSGSTTVENNLQLSVFSTSIAQVNLSTPANAATEVLFPTTLTWQKTANAASYEIQLSTDASFATDTRTITATANEYILYDMAANTTYYWRIRAKNKCGSGTFSNVFSFTTNRCSHCPSTGTADYQTGSTKVVFNTISNISLTKTSGYNDYTSVSTSVEQSATYSLSVNLNTDGNYQAETTVWIDWNQNCSFDANEKYYLGTATNTTNGPTTLSPMSIDVPANAAVGVTTMRVSTQFVGSDSTTPSPCKTNFDGEVEDYTIKVEKPLSVKKSTFEEFAFWPNPTIDGQFNVELQSSTNQDVQIELFDLRGRKIFSKTYPHQHLFRETISVEHLEAGLYILQVDDGKNRNIEKLIIE